jgi:Tfp pilus assembly protein PilF
MLAGFVLLQTGCTTTNNSESNRKKSAELKMEIGVSHLERNNLPLALKELLEATELDPSNPLIHNNLGLVYFLREKYELSAKHFLEAFTLNPQFTEAKNNLARVYIEQKQFLKATTLLNQVLADLTYTNAYSANFNYGLLLFGQNKFNEAKAYFVKILKENKEDCYAQVYYSRSLMETGQAKPAADRLEQIMPYCAYAQIDEAHFYSAIAYYRLGQKQKSLSKFLELKKMFPEGRNYSRAAQMIDLIQKEKK